MKVAGDLMTSRLPLIPADAITMAAVRTGDGLETSKPLLLPRSTSIEAGTRGHVNRYLV